MREDRALEEGLPQCLFSLWGTWALGGPMSKQAEKRTQRQVFQMRKVWSLGISVSPEATGMATDIEPSTPGCLQGEILPAKINT
ncbi:hypothetical protein COCC4DRAFT_130823 [Bipolaris maydis ATCC 48331]|uniref:Uncharacterized protein n=2 Tax=Cochliobolus heterostrophus TaxID=5016 RepID=N4XIB4_COCH4